MTMFTIQSKKSFFVILFSTLFLNISSCSDSVKNGEETAETYHHTANIAQAESIASYQISKKYIGKISSKQQSALSFEFPGRVTKIHVDSGEKVTKGQLLAELNTELLLIKSQEIKAKLTQLSAEENLNKKKLNRINSLNKQGFSSEQLQDELIAQQNIIQANMQQFAAEKQTLNYQINHAKLIAPFAGVITDRGIDQGELINANSLAFHLIKSTDVEFKVGIPAKDSQTLVIGQTFDIQVNKQTFPAQLLSISKQINTITRTIELRLRFNDQVDFLDDQLGYLLVNQTINKHGFWLPLTALTDGVRGQWNIFQAKSVSTKRYKLFAQTVKVEYITKSHAFISGLTDNHLTYVENGLHRLVGNQEVIGKENALAKTTVSNNNIGGSH